MGANRSRRPFRCRKLPRKACLRSGSLGGKVFELDGACLCRTAGCFHSRLLAQERRNSRTRCEVCASTKNVQRHPAESVVSMQIFFKSPVGVAKADKNTAKTQGVLRAESDICNACSLYFRNNRKTADRSSQGPEASSRGMPDSARVVISGEHMTEKYLMHRALPYCYCRRSSFSFLPFYHGENRHATPT